ncbi:MAG: DNA polymerase III subunit beta [Planctomycetota bacterium]|nr:DNA polymerase III subunit beta [Planctomycetota bacterium]
MNFLADRLAFRNALQRVEMGIDRKPTNPMYGGILIEAQNDSLVLMTNDLDMSVRYKLEFVQVTTPGWAVIPGRELVDIIKDLESDTVTINLTENNQVELSAGEDRCTLVTLDSSASSSAEKSESFPVAPSCDVDADLVMDKNNFLTMVNSTRFATSKVQNSRFATEGILLEAKEDKATMVGTDGRRLACISRSISSDLNSAQRAVLLPKVLDQIYRFGQDEEGEEINIWYLGNQVGFKIGNLESFGRVLTGEFPDYSQVLNIDGSNNVKAHREAFGKKLKLASHLTNDSAAVVRLKLNNNNMEISSETDGRGRASANFEVDYSGDEINTAFNPSFLMEGLKAAHSEAIEIQLEDASHPAKFILGADFYYIVMPLSSLV